MEEKIDAIIDIIGDYRIEDIGFLYKTKIEKTHFMKWLDQFEESDKEFLVDELLYLLPKSYLTKEHTLKIISTEFDIISKDCGYSDVNQFLDETQFLDIQEYGQSQKVFLGFIEEVLNTKYGRSLSNCGTLTIKNWFYADDILATEHFVKTLFLE